MSTIDFVNELDSLIHERTKTRYSLTPKEYYPAAKFKGKISGAYEPDPNYDGDTFPLQRGDRLKSKKVKLAYWSDLYGEYISKPIWIHWSDSWEGPMFKTDDLNKL